MVLFASAVIAADIDSISRRRPGFFETSGPEATWVRDLDSRAADVHDGIATLLELPAGYPTPVYVRIAAPQADGDGAFKLGIEPAGLVTLSITPGPGTTDVALRHWLARALLLRHAVWLGGVSADLAIPSWLEEAGVAASLVASQPSMSEALGREAARNGPISMAALFGGGSIEALPAWQANSWMLTQFLRSEMGRDHWSALVRDCLRGGNDAAVAVSRVLGRGGANPEVAWSAAFFNLAARHGGPGQSPRESYRIVTRKARFVFRAGGRDTVFPWERIWFWRDAEPVRREIEARSKQLAALSQTGHPFFINAYSSLQEAYRALLAPDAEGWGRAIASYEEDLSTGVELTFEAETVLDGPDGTK